jgi:phage repressor protein C with HTH and peptisase S24 domain
MGTLGERLRFARDRAGLSQKALAFKAGVSQQLISKIEKNAAAGSSTASRLARACGVPTDWLAEGVGSPDAVGEGKPDYVGMEVPVDVRDIPIVGTTQAGPDATWFELGYPSGFGEASVLMVAPHPSCYALRDVGDSMAPVIQEGQAVVCDPEAEPVPGEEVVVRLVDGQVMVKVFLSSQGGRVTLDSVNQQYKRLVIALDQIEILHPVIAVVRPSAIRWK